jgi:hypothetical protein
MCLCGLVLLWLGNEMTIAWLWLVSGWALAWHVVGSALADAGTVLETCHSHLEAHMASVNTWMMTLWVPLLNWQ